jgi:hypothetical protein
MDNTAYFEVRIASPQDAEAVSALLAASYPLLMAFGYDPILFARALPVLTKANPALLSTRTWYVVEALGADDRLVGCGRCHSGPMVSAPSLGHPFSRDCGLALVRSAPVAAVSLAWLLLRFLGLA